MQLIDTKLLYSWRNEKCSSAKLVLETYKEKNQQINIWKKNHHTRHYETIIVPLNNLL